MEVSLCPSVGLSIARSRGLHRPTRDGKASVAFHQEGPLIRRALEGPRKPALEFL